MNAPLTPTKDDSLIPCRVTHHSHDWPSGLMNAAEVSEKIGVAADRLTALAESGYVPHFIADGGNPMFKLSEVKKWCAENLLQRCDGRNLPEPVAVAIEGERHFSRFGLPPQLQQIPNLRKLTPSLVGSGIYFLCHNDRLQYVGQSVNILQRVSTHHISAHEFNVIYYIPWPKDDLNRIEAALIRTLQPPLNGRSARGQLITPNGGDDAQVLMECGFGEIFQ